MASSNRYQGSGRVREGGLGAVHRQDFRVHVEGTDWRHKADQTDMNPPVSVLNNIFNADTVQGTLEKLADIFQTAGQGFVTIGDGYDLGDYNVPTGSTIQQAFADAFTHPRLVNGGIILVKAGTYRLTATVDVPAGITIMGEVAGTYIIGSMSEQSMFRIAKSEKLFTIANTNDGTPLFPALNLDAAATLDVNCFWNIILSDNIDGYIAGSFGESIATMTTVPMIIGEQGCNVKFDHVSFLGRVGNHILPKVNTLRAFSLDDSTSAPSWPTTLTAVDCYFDGMANAILFNIKNGALDTLNVRGCRARTLSAGTAGDDTSFVAFNICHAHLSNNYHVGDNTEFSADRCFHLRSNAVVDSADIRMTIIGNEGGLRDNASVASLDQFFTSSYASTAEGLISGNAWGGSKNNPWYVTVGDGTSSVGDLTGPGAIDVLTATSGVGANSDIIAIVGYGSYTVTGSISGDISLIGKPHSHAYPVLTLNSGYLDTYSNPTASLGRHIENIEFRSSGAFNTVTASVGTASTSKSVVVKNCLFTDTGLFIAGGARTASNKITAEIDNCHFSQSGSFADNISVVVPLSFSSFVMSNSTCVGNGYALFVGNVSGLDTAAVKPVVLLNNCRFDQTDATTGVPTSAISAASPTGSNRYVSISHSTAKVILDHTEILSAEDDSSSIPSSVIAAGLLSPSASFKQYVYIMAQDIIFDDSKVIGPNQIYVPGSGVDSLLPAVQLIPLGCVFVQGSRFRGACAFQVTATFTDIARDAGVFLSNSEFYGFTSANSVSTTVLDLDLNKFTVDSTGVFPQVSIDNCYINSKSKTSNSNTFIEHNWNITTSAYHTIGSAQIYAPGWNVRVNNCIIDGQSGTALPSTSPGTAVRLAGLVIDVLGPSSPTETDAFILMSNNEVKLSNESVTVDTYLVELQGARLNICNNAFNYAVTSAGSANARSFMYIQTDNALDDGSVISGNTFGRSGGGDLATQGILIKANSGSGMFVDNDFDEYTLDGSDTTLFTDSATTPWIIERNRNQTVSFNVSGQVGVYTVIAGNAFTQPVGSGDPTLTVAANASALPNVWAFDLSALLPPNVKLISGTALIQFGGTGTATGTVVMSLKSETNSKTGTTVTASTDGTSTITTSPDQNNFAINATNTPVFAYINFSVGESAGSTVTALSQLTTLTYRW